MGRNSRRKNKDLQEHARLLAKTAGMKYNEALYQLKLYRSEKMTALVKESLMATEETNHLVPAETPRVQRSELVLPGEVFTLNSWDTADGKTRILFPMDATDEELQVGIEALEESDAQLAALKAIHDYVESFEDDEDVIERCKNIPEGKQVKVTYLTRAYDDEIPYYTQAYVNEETGEGTSKHTDIPVVVKWFDEFDEWRQVDPWRWQPSGPMGESFERIISE